MYVISCPVCGSTHTMKNGRRQGRQLYVCRDCRHQFRLKREVSSKDLWMAYLDEKQTISNLSAHFGISPSTVKRRLREVSVTWKQPVLDGGGFVHIDTTYWGRNWGVLLAIDSLSGRPLYLKFVAHERIDDYTEAIESIRLRGYEVRGIIIDGQRSLFAHFSEVPVQMCQFHMRQIVRRYISEHPKLLAARALKDLVRKLSTMSEADFNKEYAAWKEIWKETINRRSHLKSGKTAYRHRRLRSAMHSIDFYLPYLFTFQQKGCQGMHNTNNKIEGIFSDLKKNLNNHSGMSLENRKRFISGFFNALLNEG